MKHSYQTGEKLLSPQEPGPVGTCNIDAVSPWLFLCEHACNRIPRSLNMLGLPQSEINRHIGWDIGILEVTRAMANTLNAPLIFQQYSRLVIDCNRPLDSSDLIPIVSESTGIPGNTHIDSDHREKRITEIWRPYQDFIRQHLSTGKTKTSILVSMHSFTPVFKGQRRPWDIGLLYNRDNRLALALETVLKTADPSLVIGMNEPYAIGDGEDYTVPEFGEATGLPHVLVEIRQDLINKKENIGQWIDLFTMACRDLEPIFMKRKMT